MRLSFDTAFGQYLIEDVVYNGRPARVLYSDGKMSAQSGAPADGRPELLFDYNQRFMELVRGVRPKRVLILGGGAFTLPAVLMKEFPEMRIDIVEIDSGLPGIAQKFFDFQPDSRVEVHIGDGSQFIAQTDENFDTIIMDVFFNNEIPPAFQTETFALNLRRRVQKHGIAAINVIASQSGRNDKPLNAIYQLLLPHFSSVQIFPAARGLSPWMLQNYLVTAHDGSHDIAAYLLLQSINF